MNIGTSKGASILGMVLLTLNVVGGRPVGRTIAGRVLKGDRGTIFGVCFCSRAEGRIYHLRAIVTSGGAGISKGICQVVSRSL